MERVDGRPMTAALARSFARVECTVAAEGVRGAVAAISEDAASVARRHLCLRVCTFASLVTPLQTGGGRRCAQAIGDRAR